MNSDLKQFMSLALLRLRHLQTEAKRQIEAAEEARLDTAKQKSELEYLRIVEELIREQNPNENSDSSISPSR